MIKELQLKNSTKTVLIDDFVYEFLTTDPFYHSVELIYNLRLHSTGRAVFQKSFCPEPGVYHTKTIYLHKLIAEKFLEKPERSVPLFIMIKSTNRLDCRVENLQWADRSTIKRSAASAKNKTGYVGVFKDRNRFVARIYVDRKPVDIGRFDSAEEAALAYNQRAVEVFGHTKGLNVIKEAKQKIEGKQEQIGSDSVAAE